MPLILEMLGYMCIAIICVPVDDINFEINLIIEPVSYVTKSVLTKN